MIVFFIEKLKKIIIFNFLQLFIKKKNMNKLNAELPRDINPKVVIASIRERILFKEFRDRQNDFEIKNISKVEANDSWDVIYLSAGTEYLAEIKVRDKALDSWDHEGWIIEEYKYKKLSELQSKSRRPLTKAYVNIFKDAIVIWDLDKVKPEFFKRDSKQMTVQNKGRVIKSVAYLKSSQGVVYRQKNDINKSNFISIEIFNFLFPENKV